ncbi:12595_t:CDS:2, partial [Gigaspora rosea]
IETIPEWVFNIKELPEPDWKVNQRNSGPSSSNKTTIKTNKEKEIGKREVITEAIEGLSNINNRMKIQMSTINVQEINVELKRRLILEELEERNLDIVALTETKLAEKRTCEHS